MAGARVVERVWKKADKSENMMADTLESWWGNVKDIQKAACWGVLLGHSMGK